MRYIHAAFGAARGKGFMNNRWGSLMRLSRRVLNLTQEDYAADFGKSQSMVAHWEAGRQAIPHLVRRKVLDILAGYYKNHPDMAHIVAEVDRFAEFSSVVYQGHRGFHGNEKFISQWNRKMGVEYAHTNLLAVIPHYSLVLELAERYTSKMLDGKSEYAKIFVYEKSILFENYDIYREITPINIGVGTVLLLQERLQESSALSPGKKWAVAITHDGTEEAI